MTAQIVKFPTRLSQTEEAELRARCAAVAADYAAPLPEGDAGLIAALQRLSEVSDRRSALHEEFAIDMDTEQDIVNAITDPARLCLCAFIEETIPRSGAGAAVKLRYLQYLDVLDGGDDGVSGRLVNQVIALLEREARS